MQLPPIVLNAKVYPQMHGDGALRLAEACRTILEETGVGIALCPPQWEISRIRHEVPELPLLAQHVDPHVPGSGTGATTVDGLRAIGLEASLLNHAERKVDHGVVASTIQRAQEHGLAILACADSDAEATALAGMSPEAIAVEPPQLIGGDISVTTADPAIVTRTVDAVRAIDSEIELYCGAGIKTGKDVAASIELGCKGVLLASGVVKAADWREALRDLARGV